jgi:hypothetical protein
LAEGMRAGGGWERSDAVVTASKMCAGMSIAMEGGRATGVDGPGPLIHIPGGRCCWIYGVISRPIPSQRSKARAWMNEGADAFVALCAVVVVQC